MGGIAPILLIPLLLGFILYCVIGIAARRVFRAFQDSKPYGVVWFAIMSLSMAWLTYFFALNWIGILQLLGDIASHPNEDMWAMKFISFCLLLVCALPLPIAVAGVLVRPASSRWLRFAEACTLLVFVALYIKLHETCELTILDQFNQPVPGARVTYYLSGRQTGVSDKNGIVPIPFFRPQRLSVVDAAAGGYVIDYRMCSHKQYEQIPDKAALPAWKILRVPKLLLSRPSIPVITDGRPYYVNLLREKASSEPLPIADLEVSVEAPLELPPRAGEQRKIKPFPWNIHLRVAGGGLQKAPAGYQYLAPKTGYVSSFTQRFDPSAPDWTCGGGGGTFYLRLRDGKVYAIARITLTTLEEKDRRLFVDATVNPAADESLFSGYGGTLDHSRSETKPWLTALFGEEY